MKRRSVRHLFCDDFCVIELGFGERLERLKFASLLTRDFDEQPIYIGIVRALRNILKFCSRNAVWHFYIEFLLFEIWIFVHCKHRFERSKRHFEHIVGRFFRGKFLKSHTGRAKYAYEQTITLCKQFEQLVRNACNDWQEQQLKSEFDKRVQHLCSAGTARHDKSALFEHEIDQHEHHYAHRNHEKEESRSAARVFPRHMLCVFDGEVESAFVARYNLVFRAVIHKHSAHVFHQRDEKNVRYKNHKHQTALDKAVPKTF